MLVGGALLPFFNHMPFGARHSPRIFTRALSYALRYIRVHWDVRIVAYMDDLLLLHQDPVYLRLAKLQIAAYLQSLGWTLSLAKCEFTPKQKITFLGWQWDFISLSLRMTQEMRKTLLFMIKQWLRRAVAGAKVSCKKLGRLIGCFNFLRAQIPRASLYLRTLHTALAEMVRLKGWNGWGLVTRRIISELLFWWRSVWYNAPYGFRPRPMQALLTTNAAERG
jgi:hypothetical protein